LCSGIISDAEDFEPTVDSAPVVSDRWEGEDEDDEIKVKVVIAKY